MPDSTAQERRREGTTPSQVVRGRLVIAILAEYVVLMAIAAVEGFWPAGGIGHELALLLLFAVGLGLPIAMARMAGWVVHGVVALELERERLLQAYGRAREDSLLDGLTGLGNHRAFQEELARQLDIARRNGAGLALMLIDVDNLKQANDANGHAAGDELLAAVGRIAVATARRSDRAFRIGGDEFAILLPEADAETGLLVANRILAGALRGGDPARPVEPFSLSIGVSAFPSPSIEGHLLYRHADAALYWCKRHGRTAAVTYDPELHRGSQDERSLAELTAAVDEVLTGRLLRPVYQPIFSLETGRPIGWEALIRPIEGAPFDDASSLFSAAAAAGRTVELDLACLEIVAAGIRDLPGGAHLSVNVSPRTLESHQFHVAEIVAPLKRHGLAPAEVVIEMTEREEVEDIHQLARSIEACRTAGFRLAADDLGAGNAGLRLLSEIHFDTVKLDLSLVQSGTTHDPTHAVLAAVQEIAARWNATIVAEGVETPDQLRVIRDLGIAAGQGYLLGRPAPTIVTAAIDLDALTQEWATPDEEPSTSAA